jgi:hypothetical protein
MVAGAIRNFEVFDRLDSLAAVTEQSPNRGEPLVRYYGYSFSLLRGRCRSLPHRSAHRGSSGHRRLYGMRIQTNVDFGPRQRDTPHESTAITQGEDSRSARVTQGGEGNSCGPADASPMSTVREGGDSKLYANRDPDLRPQGIYAETEQNTQGRDARPPLGEAFLPPGRYRAEFVLTGEGFHGYGDADFWTTVMQSPVELAIEDRPRPRTRRTTLRPAAPTFDLRKWLTEDIEVRLRREDGMAPLRDRDNQPRVESPRADSAGPGNARWECRGQRSDGVTRRPA